MSPENTDPQELPPPPAGYKVTSELPPPPAGYKVTEDSGTMQEPIGYRNGMPVYSIDVYGRAGPPPQPPVFQGMDAEGKPIIASPPGPPTPPMAFGLLTPQQQKAETPIRLNPRTGLPMTPMPMGANPPLDPLAGAEGMAAGFERMAEPFGGMRSPADAYTPGGMEVAKGGGREQAGGASQIIRGGLQVAAPLLPGAFVAAPLATALTLGAGTALSAGTEAGLNWAGVPKEYSALVSDLVGLYGAHRTLKWMGKIANLPYDREAESIKPRIDAAMEQANDPNATPMDRAAAKARVAALMDGLKEAEAGSPGGYFFPQVSIGRTPGTPWVKNQLNPIEQASQDYLREQGINTPLSMQTGDPRAAHLEGAVRQSLGGGYANEARNLTRQQIEALGPREFGKIGPEVTPEEAGGAVRGKLAGDLEQQRKALVDQVAPTTTTPELAGGAVGKKLAADLETMRRAVTSQVSPTATTPELAGAKVLEKGKQTIRQFHQAAKEAYDAAWVAERDPRNIRQVPTYDKNGREILDDEGSPVTEAMALPVDVTDVARQLKPIADKYERTLSDTDAHASLGLKTMRNFIKDAIQSPQRPLSAVEMDLGMLKDAARTENLPELRDESQGLAAASVKALQAKIDATMAQAKYPGWDGTGTSPALRHLQSGRLNTAKKWAVEDIYKPFGRNIEQVEPVAAFKRMTWSGDAGIQHLRNVATIAPEHMPEVGRAFIDNGGKWGMLGPETKKILFRDPEVIKNLDAYYAKKEQFGPLTEKEPVALFKSLTAKGDAGIEQLREIAKQAPEHMAAVGRAYIDSGGKWESLGPETKKVLFKDPELIKNLDEYFVKHEKFGGLTEMNPVDLFNKLTAPEGKPNELLADLKQHAPEQMPGLLRAFVGELWNRVTQEGDFKKVQSTLNTWLKMDPKTKAMLVDDPKTVSNLNNLFFSLNRLVHEVNPSGSGYIIALNKMKGDLLKGMGMIGAGVGGFGGHGAPGAGVGIGAGYVAGAGAEVLANKGLARLLFDPRFTKLLTQGIKFQLQGNNEGARLIGESLSRMLSGEQPPPEGQPPSGGGPPSTPPEGGGGAAPAEGGTAAKPATGGGLYDQLQQAGEEAKQRLKKGFSGGQLYSMFPGDKAIDLATLTAAGVTKGAKSLASRAINDMGEWGAARIANGAVTFPEWKKQMLDDAMDVHPQAVEFLRRNARAVYQAAQQTWKDRQGETLNGKITDIEKILQYAEAGKEGTYWYKNVKPQLEPIFGPNTDLFLNFLAATSPRTPVADNVTRALQAYSEHLSGKPFSTEFEAHLQNLQRAAKGEPLSGLKVGSFGPNLLGDFIKVTVDTWMGQAYGFKGGISNPQYRFLDYAISQAAKAKGLQPAEMQAAIWTGIKKLEGDPRLTAEPFETVVKQYLKENPDLAKQIDKAMRGAAPDTATAPTLEQFRTGGEKEPPVKSGFVRLYRGHEAGEAPTKSLEGNWWTPELEHAEQVALDATDGHRQVSYVDIPKADLKQYSAYGHPEAAKMIGPGEDPYILPQSVSATRKPLFRYRPPK